MPIAVGTTSRKRLRPESPRFRVKIPGGRSDVPCRLGEAKCQAADFEVLDLLAVQHRDDLEADSDDASQSGVLAPIDAMGSPQQTANRAIGEQQQQ